MLSQSSRTFVERLDFRTTVGFGDGYGSRRQLGFGGRGVTSVITDLGVLEPNAETSELTLTHVHEGIESDDVRAATGWPLQVSEALSVEPRPTHEELAALRTLKTALEA